MFALSQLSTRFGGSMLSKMRYSPVKLQRHNRTKRTYATMRHTETYITPDYSEPKFTLPATLRPDPSNRGRRYGKLLREQAGLIPAILNRGKNGKPLLLEMDPSAIFSLMKAPNSRFLGRRYYLQIDKKVIYEVIPQHLEVHPMTYFPEAVTFTLWDPAREPKLKVEKRFHDTFYTLIPPIPTIEEQNKAREDDTHLYYRLLDGESTYTKAIPWADYKSGAYKEAQAERRALATADPKKKVEKDKHAEQEEK